VAPEHPVLAGRLVFSATPIPVLAWLAVLWLRLAG
jgi:hypothetical protein